MKNTHIGGEYFYSPSILFTKNNISIEEYVRINFPDKFYSFTGGGHFSIATIINNLKTQIKDEVLLPSYICPTVLIPFKKQNIRYRFYKINENLKIDINDLQNKINHNVKAVFFINYFGFPQDEDVKLFLRHLKQKGIIIIEDLVQSFFSRSEVIGNYAFNSLRKFMPVDGSVIISDDNQAINPMRSLNKYFFCQVAGRYSKYFVLKTGFKTDNLFLGFFDLAKKNYYTSETFGFNAYNKYIFSKINIDQLRMKRINNFQQLLKNLNKYSLFNELPDKVTPLCLPILIEDRDKIRSELAKKNIYCPVHWKLSEEISRMDFKESWYLSEKILSIPLSENIDHAGLKYLLQNLQDNL